MESMTSSHEAASPCATNTITMTTTSSVPPFPRRQEPWALHFLWLTAAALAGLVLIYLAARQKIAPWRLCPAYLALLLISNAGTAL
jgi:hypothetical protein